MFANSIPRARLWAMLIAALCTPVAGASNVIAPPQDTELSLAEALRRAESRHPLFQSYRAQLAAAEARTRQARLRPAPELNLELEDALGSGALSGLDKAQTTIGFSQLIERGGLRDRRLDARRAEREGLVTEAEIARLDLRAEVARRFIHVLSDQAQLGIAHQATRLARSTLAEVNRRVDAARAPLAERSRAQVSLARAELEEEHAEHELLSARRHLAAATGVMAPDFGALVGDLLQLPEVAAFDVLLAQMQTTPDVLLFANQARLRASELRLAQARRSTSVRVGAGLRRVEATDDVGLVFSAALPLFSRARAAGAIAENEARLAEVGPAREQAWLKAQAHLFALYQELSHARIEYEAQRDRVVPAMEEALKQTQYAYRRGRYSLLELRDAQAEWAVQKARLIEAATEYHGHLIEIQRLTGAPAPGVSPTESNAP
ncbi:MAG: TolC family protein [Pseudomonadota bacterium]|jgi:outer membrane protein, heavy metal efflux system|nr:TolC family protein [Gammaproteobacteria bacterium]MEC8849420.1 TolC family protein [Pseudomonadota bacterium]|tara:strand:- start:29162 stop:30466 length:1305 start_codon:yes stop_codon:yes gene_type:complete